MSKHIIVVEDDAPVRFIVCRILREGGYVVSEASDDRQVKLLMMSANQSNFRFDLMLFDVQMPSIYGSELLGELKRLDNCPPVLLMTGEVPNRQAHLVNDEQCLGIITKPWDLVTLLDGVENAFAVLSGRPLVAQDVKT